MRCDAIMGNYFAKNVTLKNNKSNKPQFKGFSDIVRVCKHSSDNGWNQYIKFLNSQDKVVKEYIMRPRPWPNHCMPPECLYTQYYFDKKGEHVDSMSFSITIKEFMDKFNRY